MILYHLMFVFVKQNYRLNGVQEMFVEFIAVIILGALFIASVAIPVGSMIGAAVIALFYFLRVF